MYPRNTFPQKCVAAIGSMTAAIKAQRALLSANISAEVIALAPEETRRGCAYGVEFAAISENAARAVFRAARISVSQYILRD